VDCPREDTIVAFADGSISAAQRSRIEAHIDGCPECAALVADASTSHAASLDTRAMGGASSHETPVRTTSGERSRGTLAPSTRLGRYMVLEELGEGGMGRVYSAYDPELDRRIALKLLRPELAGRKDPSMGHARLLREAQAMARLSHPNVLTVHDVGEVDPRTLEGDVQAQPSGLSNDKPLVFIAMELVDGRDLRAWCNEQERSWGEVLAVFLDAGEGLAAAHAAGLLHRDFKPDNVLIDREDHVRVMDFGLARAVDDRPSHRRSADLEPSINRSLDDSLTRTGTAMGTPAYMAPEQWTTADIDARADQFAFCISFWEALYGRRPFRGKSEAALREAVASGVVEPPENRRGVPAWLHRAVMRGLQVDREQRHASMRALLDELRARPRRRRILGWSGAGSMVFLAVGAIAYQGGRSTRDTSCRSAPEAFDTIWSPGQRTRIEEAFAGTQVPFADSAWKSARDSIDSYRTRWVSSHTETCEATHVHGSQSTELLDLRMDCLQRQLTALQALLELFATADTGVVEKAPLATARLPDPHACTNIETLRARVPADPRIRDEVAAMRDELTRARVGLHTGRPGDAAEVAERIAASARTLDHVPLEAEALRTLGDALDGRGEVDEASSTLRRALVLAERAADDELASSIWASLTFIDGFARGHTDVGLLAADYADAKLSRVGPNPQAQAQLHSNRASALYAAGRLAEATRHQREAVDTITNARGQHDLLRARFLLNLGAYQLAAGELESALVSHRTSLDIHEAELGPDHPSLVRQYAGLGSVLHTMGRSDDARVHLERALSIAQTQPDPDRRVLASVLNNLGNVLSRLGEQQQALERLEQSLALRRALLGEDNPDIAQSLDNIGNVLLALDRPEDALARHEEALRLRHRTQGDEHPWLAYSLHGIGESRLARGQVDEAIEALEQALSIGESDAPDRAATEFALARALWEGKRQHARVLELARDAHARMTGHGDASRAETVQQWLAERGMAAVPPSGSEHEHALR
jgi:eukaryotic-like serine/threonine-protein kinase